MTWSLLKWLPLFLISTLFESGTHLCLKKASQPITQLTGVQYYIAIARSKIVWAGISLYISQIAVWIFILSSLPLSVAFPLSGIEKPVMVLSALFFLKEPLSKREWFALALIFAGIICVGAAAPETI